MNNSAIEKGLFRAQALKKYFETIKKNPASSQIGIFMKPDRNKVDNLKDANYDKLTEEGYAKVETVIKDGDVIIGMVNPKPTSKEDEKPYKDNSTIYKSLVPGAIDKVITGINSDGYSIIKVRARSERIPAIGDKFSSRAGQKATIGSKPHRADMPFTKSGLVTDIIINPNAIPKRMTIGQLIECLMAKVCAIKGVYGDATPFTGVDIEQINKELVDAGYEEWGNETMYNGMTGKKMAQKMFIGPTYYQRLKQMVGDKAHCLSIDHEVLTLNGWKFNHQLTMDDKIATLVDGKLVYQKPKKIFNYPDYKGDMYHITTQQIDLMVTPNHRMYVSKYCDKWEDYDFELAKDIVGKHRKYKKDAIWDVKDYQLMLPDPNMDMDSWLTFFGLWFLDGGSTWKCPDSKSYCIGLFLDQQAIDVLIPAIKKLGYDYRQENRNFTITNKQLYKYMKQFSEENKFLPDWVWLLSSRQARILLESIILSDGLNDIIITPSVKLADDLMRLALHCGWSCNKYLNIEASYDSSQDIWELEINKSPNINRPEINHGYAHQQIIKDYNKPVFCLEVENGIFYVRRNGIPIWTGNSRARGPTQLLTRQPPEGLAHNIIIHEGSCIVL
ncbi:MAG: intein-containing dna-directed rna polymerase subunit 2 [Satyrvirus sp.]|uniref:DNA-directed RNA polymerase n=1 Tax=Satyrvirus sp. TaxID=2487771 RepID=A0A3G5AJC7_9VIRU|nr:MAG: intein-containing dna-directed rna polymerase subunit 2 [Satyrvirus sp.]